MVALYLAQIYDCVPYCMVRQGPDWTVGKSVIDRTKFTPPPPKKKKKKREKKKIHKERPKHIDQKGPLIYELNLTEKGLQIFMCRI